MRTAWVHSAPTAPTYLQGECELPHVGELYRGKRGPRRESSYTTSCSELRQLSMLNRIMVIKLHDYIAQTKNMSTFEFFFFLRGNL